MKITIQDDDGKETVYIAVREFALCGLRMDAPMNPSHFQHYAGTTGYLCGQLSAMFDIIVEEDRKRKRGDNSTFQEEASHVRSIR